MSSTALPSLVKRLSPDPPRSTPRPQVTAADPDARTNAFIERYWRGGQACPLPPLATDLRMRAANDGAVQAAAQAVQAVRVPSELLPRWSYPGGPAIPIRLPRHAQPSPSPSPAPGASGTAGAVRGDVLDEVEQGAGVQEAAEKRARRGPPRIGQRALDRARRGGGGKKSWYALV